MTFDYFVMTNKLILKAVLLRLNNEKANYMEQRKEKSLEVLKLRSNHKEMIKKFLDEKLADNKKPKKSEVESLFTVAKKAELEYIKLVQNYQCQERLI